MREEDLKGKVFEGVFWKFAERVLAQLASFVVSVILARILLPKDYGVVALIMIFITLANVFVTSGFSTALIQNRDADETDFSTNFYCSLFVAVLLYMILFFLAPVLSDFYDESLLTPIIRVFSLRLLFSAYNSIQHAYVSRYMMFKKFFFSTLFGTVLSGGVGILMAMMGWGAWALVAQYLMNTVVDIVILNFTVPWHPKLKFSWTSAKKMINYGWKILAADLIGTFFDQLRSLIIGKVYTTSDLAYYNKGQQLPSLISTNVSESIMSVLFPAISNVGDNREQIKQMLRRSVRIMSYVMFPLLIGLASIAKPLVVLLYTEKWVECVPYIQLLSLSSAIGLLGTTGLQTIKAIGRSDVLLSLEVVKKPVYLVLLILGMQKSVLAVAVTMVIYAVYSCLVNAYQLKTLVNYNYLEQFKDILSPIMLSVSMLILLNMYNYLSVEYIVILILQIVSGIVYYLLMSKVFQVDAFVYLVSYVKEKFFHK